MPSCPEKVRETVKKWKKENPDKVKEQKKRYRMKNAKANYEKVKTWRREHLEQRRRQKERERCSKRLKSKEEDLPIINFDCDEAIASEQQHQDLEDLNELITSELEEDLIAAYHLSLLDG